MLHGRDAMLIPFSLLWGGFAIFWNASVWGLTFEHQGVGSPDIFFKLWGLPFLMFGIYMIVGRFFHDAYVRRHTLYAVTDQRIVILSRGKMTSLEPARLPRLELTEHRDNRGTLSFETASAFSWNGMNGFGWWVPALEPGAKFLHISDPQIVYRIIRDRTRASS